MYNVGSDNPSAPLHKVIALCPSRRVELMHAIQTYHIWKEGLFRHLATVLKHRCRSKLYNSSVRNYTILLLHLENQSENGDTNAESEPWSELTKGVDKLGQDCGMPTFTSETKLTAGNDSENQPQAGPSGVCPEGGARGTHEQLEACEYRHWHLRPDLQLV
ncbi:hypothetical protein EDB92DRAFT_1876759, partial [Lactarius akahatsu]